jgi:DHA1 family multidrug resistance protein-like MFS transporter
VGGIVPTISALLASYTRPGEEGSVFGLDSSIFAASRAVAPLAGSGLALWFGLRPTFLFAGLIYFAMVAIAVWRLPQTQASLTLRPGD